MKGTSQVVNFTKQDLDVLFDAVESWEKEDRGPGFMGQIFSGMIGERSPEAAEKMQKELDVRQQKADAERRIRKERGVVLRAKLIALRDSVVADDFLGSCAAQNADACKSQAEGSKS